MACIKNIVAHGAPSQRKKILSLELMKVLAKIIGGINLHRIFFLPTNNKSSLPFIYAEIYVETIKQNNKIYLEIHTLYILFIENWDKFLMSKCAKLIYFSEKFVNIKLHLVVY